MAIVQNKNWIKFINEYKNLPELWDVKCVDYKRKSKKRAAYDRLTKLYSKTIDETATADTVKKRIKNMRFVYKRELRKKFESERRGLPYESNLWYFHQFDFLKTYEMPEREAFELTDWEGSSNTPVKSEKRKKPSNISNKNELLQKAVVCIDNLNYNKNRDEANIYGEGWTHSYRKLSTEQKLYAKKAIDEILILGELGRLTFNVVRTDMSSDYNTVEHQSSPAYHEDEEII